MPGRLRRLRSFIGLMVCTVSLGVLAWGVWPQTLVTESLSIPDGGRLFLSWPAAMRAGDSQLIHLEINPGGPESQEIAAGEDPPNLMAAARLEFTGLLYTPAEMVSQPLRAGRPVAFNWQVRPERRGVYQGVAWLYYLSVPQDGGPETSRPISAKEIEIRAADLFGLSGLAARILGGLGFLAGALLALEGAWARLRSRRNQDQRRLEMLTIDQ